MSAGWLGVLFIAVGLLASIALHEFGHYVPARRFGASVPEFAVGFGPRLFSRTFGPTVFVWRLLPFGGFVRILGMFPPASDPQAPKGGNLAQSAREHSALEVAAEGVRPFYEVVWWRRAIVMLGGPMVNLAIWAVLSLVVLVGTGLPGLTSSVRAVSDCVPVAGESECSAVDPVSPAKLAGLRAGDVVVSVAGVEVDEWGDVRSAMESARPGVPVSVVVDRAGTRVVFDVVPAASPFIEGSGYLGLSPDLGLVRSSVLDVPGVLAGQVQGAFAGLVQYPGRMAETVSATAEGRERAPDGPVGVVGIGRVGGQLAEMQVLTPQMRFVQLLAMIAGLNLFLGIFNLLPVLPLDGGHVAAACFEGLRGFVARRRGRPAPGPVDLARLLPVSYAMGALVLVSSLVLLWADVVNPVNLFG